MKRDPADVSAIVVNFNSGEYLAPCLESLSREESDGLRIERIVVDNASTIDQSQFLENASRTGARVVRSDRNSGYGGGCNLGLRATTARFVLFLNADVKACPGCLPPLVRFLEEHSDVAFVEPRTYADDARLFMIPEFEPLTPALVAGQALARLSSAAALRLSLRRMRLALPGWMAGEPREQKTLTGAFLMGRRAVIDGLGGFDEGFPLYFEDSDLFLRARRRWLRRAFGPLAVALDVACEALLRCADRARTPAPFLRCADLGARADPPELLLDGAPGPFLLELAVDPGFLLAAVHFGDGERFRIPDLAWRSLLPARYFLRALHPSTFASRGAWTFERIARGCDQRDEARESSCSGPARRHRYTNTNRRTPAARACSIRRRVASSLTARISGSASSCAITAAQCTTTAASRTSDERAPASRRSPDTTSMPAGTAAGLRSRTRTGTSRSSRRSTKWRPTSPLAPVTEMRSAIVGSRVPGRPGM
jgi:hypothetical protein